MNMNDILLKLQQKVEQEIFESMNKKSNKITVTGTTSNNGITKDQLDRVLDEYLKNKIEIKMSPYVPKHEVLIVDCEEMRKEFSNSDLRGKLILCNPADYGTLKDYGF